MEAKSHLIQGETAPTGAVSAGKMGEHCSEWSSTTGWKQRLIRWGIGSSLLSIAGLIALGLFEQYNGMLAELRTDLKRFNELSAEYVKRDQLQRCREQVWQNTKELQAVNAARLPLEHELRASERCREELAKEMQRLRERLAYVEGQQAVKAYVP